MKSVDVFEPRSNAWRRLSCDMRTSRSNFGTAVFGEGNCTPSVVVCGGYEGEGTTNMCEMFIPRGSYEYTLRHFDWDDEDAYDASDIYAFDWRRTTSASAPSEAAGSGTGTLPDGEWVSIDPMPTSRSALSAVVISGFDNVSEFLLSSKEDTSSTLDDWFDMFDVPEPPTLTSQQYSRMAREWSFRMSSNSSTTEPFLYSQSPSDFDLKQTARTEAMRPHRTAAPLSTTPSEASATSLLNRGPRAHTARGGTSGARAALGNGSRGNSNNADHVESDESFLDAMNVSHSLL